MEQLTGTKTIENRDRSDLSDFVGSELTVYDSAGDALRLGQDKVVSDHMDYALRAYDLLEEGYGIESLSYGPASAPTVELPLTELMRNSPTFQRMFYFFDGVAYDSVNFRITCSAPKGLTGGFIVGSYPYQPWGDVHPSIYFTSHDLNDMTRKHLTLSPYSALVCYAQAEDISFEIPWQHNVDYLPRQYFSEGITAFSQPWPGTPVLYFTDAGSRYVSSQSLPATIRVFVKFTNLRFVAPSVLTQVGGPQSDHASDEPEDSDEAWFTDLSDRFNSGRVEPLKPHVIAALEKAQEEFWTDVLTGKDPFLHQSGVEFGTMAAATAGTEIVSALTKLFTPDDADSNQKGSYENPRAVQMAYVGDSTVRGPPPTNPIFKGFGAEGNTHPISEMISQPQWIHSLITGETHVYYANPTAPVGVSNVNGTNQLPTYLRFFSQASTYWRGTLYFDFVIMGHPMVEVEYKCKMLYPPWSENTTETYSQNSIMRGIASGVVTISVPMPYMTPKDYMEIVDSTILTDQDLRRFSSSLVSFTCNVISTALDASPTIPIAVFLRAGDDFAFYQPEPVGYANVYEHQVKIPGNARVFETRALDVPPINEMVPFTHVESFMSIWSRALPFGSYDSNDEPVVALEWSTSPSWFPMNDSAAARTLGTQNSWYVTNDYVSLFSSMYLFFKGSIALKILCLPGTGYKYLSLSTGDARRQTTHNPFTASPSQLPDSANFGYGCVATDLAGQPVLEATIPLRSVFEWAPVNPLSFDVVMYGLYRTSQMVGQLRHNVVLHVPSGDLQDALYRKIGADFSLAVRTLLPPPTLWMVRGNNWS